MIRQKIITRISAAGALLTLAMGLLVPVVQAASGNLYVSLSSASVQNGKTFTANVRINPGGSISAVDVYLNYDPAKVAFKSISYTGSPFLQLLDYRESSGTVYVSAGNRSAPVTTDVLVASVTFVARVGSGNMAFSLSGSNAAYAGARTDPTLTGATISFASPPVSCPSGQIGTPPNCTTPVKPVPKPTPTPSPKPTRPTPVETAPKPSPATANINPALSEPFVQYTSAKLKVATRSSARVYARYGLNKDRLVSSTPVSSAGKNHEVSFEEMVPGATVYYTVFSKNDKGQTVQSEIQSFTLKGFDVKVTVLDRNRKPLKNAKVTLHSTPQTATTDANGQVTFTNVTPGEHSLAYKSGSKTLSKQVIVANDVTTEGDTQTAMLQNFSVVYDLTQSSSKWLMPTIYAWLLAVGVFAVYKLLGRRRAQPQYAYDSTLASKITVGGNPPAPGPGGEVTLTSRLNHFPTPTAISPGTVVQSHENSDSSDGSESRKDGEG